MNLSLRSIILVPGAWDLLHIGHIKFLERARKLGDILIVAVQDDESYFEQKGHYPAITTKNRILALESLKCVDIAVSYYELDYVKLIRQYNANVFVLSESYKNSTEPRFINARRYMSSDKRGKIFYLPYDNDISSTKIKKKVLEQEGKKVVWGDIWEKVGGDPKMNDIEVGSDALSLEKIERLADYFVQKLGIKPGHKVLDFGCGSGMLLKNINTNLKFGIDCSPGMIERAIKNCPEGIFLVDNHIPYRNRFDHIICYGVIYYLDSLISAEQLIDEMIKTSDSIMIMEIPDIDKKAMREKNRDKLGKAKYPEQLYFSKKFFEDKGFEVFDNEISVTNHSDFGFTALRK